MLWKMAGRGLGPGLAVPVVVVAVLAPAAVSGLLVPWVKLQELKGRSKSTRLKPTRLFVVPGRFAFRNQSREWRPISSRRFPESFAMLPAVRIRNRSRLRSTLQENRQRFYFLGVPCKFFAGRIEGGQLGGVRFAFRRFWRLRWGVLVKRFFHFGGEGVRRKWRRRWAGRWRLRVGSGWRRRLRAGSGVWCRRRHADAYRNNLLFGLRFPSLPQGTTRIPFDHGPNCEKGGFGSSLMVRTTESRFPLILEPMAVMFFPSQLTGTSSVSPTGVKSVAGSSIFWAVAWAAKIRVKTAVKNLVKMLSLVGGRSLSIYRKGLI